MVQRVHFTWIGAPRLDRSPAPDVLGPDSLRSARVRNGGDDIAIHFWCLDRYVDQYTRHFDQARGRPVAVRSIERYLETQRGVRGGRRRRLGQSLINGLWSMFSWDIDLVVWNIVAQGMRQGVTIREVVNAKNVWSMYILLKLGGYAMDTGVVAAPDGMRLRGYDTMKVPAEGENQMGIHVRPLHASLRDRCSTVTMTTGAHLLGDDADYPLSVFPRVDVWTIYGPAGDEGIAYALGWYIRYWYLLEAVRTAPQADVETYKNLCRHGVICAVSSGLTHANVTGLCGRISDARSIRGLLWDAQLEGADAGVAEVGIKKHYFGSHH